MRVVYVVLHYLAIKDTIECVNSILENVKSKKNDSNIVLVDNGSPNNSYKILEQLYGDNNRVDLIRSEKNLGFAKGNNLGFIFAKEKRKADFIVLLNNDTIISQPDFTDVIVDKYEKTGYSVLGPDIITADGYHQNPGEKQTWNLVELINFRLKKRICLLLSYIGIDTLQESLTKETKGVYRTETLTGDVKNTILHGACLIFSPLFITRFDGLCDETFLYMEEDILKLYSDYYDFLMLYTSDLKLYHKEDAATNMDTSTSIEKIRAKYKRLIRSSKVYSKHKRRMLLKKRIINRLEKAAGEAKNGRKYRIDYDIPITYLADIALQRIVMAVRGKIKTLGMKKAGKLVFIGEGVKLKCKSKMQIGTGVTIQRKVFIDALSRSGLVLEDGSSIGSKTIIRCSGNYTELGKGFHLGKNSSLADNCFVGATGGVYIGDNVIGGQNIRFHSSNHIFNDTNILIKDQGINAKGIKVGNNCWIGAGVVFCDGVTIGDGCVIGANAVVTKSFPDNSVIIGNPARLLRFRGKAEEDNVNKKA